MIKLSYGITVHNEAEELKRLLNILTDKIDKDDEIVVCIDGDDDKVEAVLGDYIFHIDADEYPNDGLLEYVKPILEANEIDLIWVPRVNTVNGITEQHIQQWGWRVSEAGWVNYPDYQSRIFKNTPELRWQNKVHERIMGAKNYSHLPPNESLSLYHPKTIEKQEKQNKFYETL